jgi:mycofactocin precursor
VSDIAATAAIVIEDDAANAAPEPSKAPPTEPRPAALVEADLLVEDVSIDGMCGVY